MTLQLKPGHNLNDEEVARLEALLALEYPDEDLEIIVEDAPAAEEKPPAASANVLQRLVVLVITGMAGVYLVNPTAGVLELIPDVVPVLGNLDEATALALLISGLGYFGVNVGWLTTIFHGLQRK